MDSKKRCSKTIRQQFEVYLNELGHNKAFRENKFDARDPDAIKKSWEQLTVKLNSLGGPVKSVNSWKRTFTDWKSQVKSKARKIKYDFKETGNVGTPIKPLTDLEDLLLSIIGKVVVDGFREVPELGIEQPITKKEEQQPEEQQTSSTPSKQSSVPCTSSKTSGSTEPPSKKRASITKCLENFVSENKTCIILEEICNNIKESNKIKKKTLKLKLLVLKVKFPEYDFVLTSSDSE